MKSRDSGLIPKRNMKMQLAYLEQSKAGIGMPIFLKKACPKKANEQQRKNH